MQSTQPKKKPDPSEPELPTIPPEVQPIPEKADPVPGPEVHPQEVPEKSQPPQPEIPEKEKALIAPF